MVLGPDRAVNIVNSLLIAGFGVRKPVVKRFFTPVQTQPTLQRPEAARPGVQHPFQSSAEVKHGSNYTSTYRTCRQWQVTR